MDVEYFYSLVNLKQDRKKRVCLRCRKNFISSHAGHRICGACSCIISGQGFMASDLPDFSNAGLQEEVG